MPRFVMFEMLIHVKSICFDMSTLNLFFKFPIIFMFFNRDDRTPQRQATSNTRPPNTEESRVHHRQVRREQDQDIQFVCEEFAELSFTNSNEQQVVISTCMQ